MIASIMATAEKQLAQLNVRRRETCSASDLVVGVQCGGSDAFSGVIADPAVGFASDLLVWAGATVMFFEVTEVRDGIDQLTSRAINAPACPGCRTCRRLSCRLRDIVTNDVPFSFSGRYRSAARCASAEIPGRLVVYE
jgi:hypothetical protein